MSVVFFSIIKLFFFGLFSQLLKLRFTAMVTYSFHLYFPQFTSFHSVFHSFHGLMNSINWPASSIWVFIAQLGEHCSANAEATGSNPVEAPKNFLFSGYFRNCLSCDSVRWSHTHFICIPRSSHHFIQCFIPFTG